MLFRIRKDKSLKISLPATKQLYGVKIVKLPIARYISALSAVENLPHILAGELSGESGSIDELIANLKAANPDTLEKLIRNLLVAVPTELCHLLSELLDIPEERLLDKNCQDPLSPNELAEILLAFWEVNDMNDFFGNVRKLGQKLTARSKTAANIGYSGGSQ